MCRCLSWRKDEELEAMLRVGRRLPRSHRQIDPRISLGSWRNTTDPESGKAISDRPYGPRKLLVGKVRPELVVVATHCVVYILVDRRSLQSEESSELARHRPENRPRCTPFGTAPPRPPDGDRALAFTLGECDHVERRSVPQESPWLDVADRPGDAPRTSRAWHADGPRAAGDPVRSGRPADLRDGLTA